MPISLSGSLNLSGSLTTTGTITATTLVVQTITSSISSITGSTNFGSLSSDTHKFTGSLLVSGSVGIGTTSPSYTLDVSGSIRNSATQPTSYINYTDATSYGNLIFTESGTNKGVIQFIGSTFATTARRNNFEIVNGANSDMTLWTNNTVRMTISSSGNVGIGTSSPSDILDVQKNQNATTNVYFRNTNNTDANSRMYLNLVAGNAAAGIAVLAGGSGTGSLYIGGVNNGEIYFQPYLGGTVTMTLKSSGNIGIGTTSPSYLLDVVNSSNPSLRVRNGALGGTATLLLETANDFSGTCQTYIKCIGTSSNGRSELTFATAGGTGDATATERMRITSGGAINFNSASVYTGAGCVNTTVSSSSDFCFVGLNTNASNPRGLYLRNSATTGGDYALYFEAAGATKFYVTGNGVIYSTNSSVQAISDVRHKENIRDLNKGLSEILSLQPRLFDWKEGKGTGSKNVMGFIAQEVETIFPELISNWKENIDATESFKTIAMSNMIPYLVKAIQELTARVQYLENK